MTYKIISAATANPVCLAPVIGSSSKREIISLDAPISVAELNDRMAKLSGLVEIKLGLRFQITDSGNIIIPEGVQIRNLDVRRSTLTISQLNSFLACGTEKMVVTILEPEFLDSSPISLPPGSRVRFESLNISDDNLTATQLSSFLAHGTYAMTLDVRIGSSFGSDPITIPPQSQVRISELRIRGTEIRESQLLSLIASGIKGLLVTLCAKIVGINDDIPLPVGLPIPTFSISGALPSRLTVSNFIYMLNIGQVIIYWPEKVILDRSWPVLDILKKIPQENLAQLSGPTPLYLPQFLIPGTIGRYTLDSELNHRNNAGRGILQWLQNLPNENNTEKIALLNLILPKIPIEELRQNRSLQMSLADVIFLEPFGSDPTIQTWTANNLLPTLLDRTKTEWAELSFGILRLVLPGLIARLQTLGRLPDAGADSIKFHGSAWTLAQFSGLMNVCLIYSKTEPGLLEIRKSLNDEWKRLLPIPGNVTRTYEDPYGFIGYREGQLIQLWVDETYLTECLVSKTSTLGQRYNVFYIVGPLGEAKNVENTQIDLDQAFDLFQVFQADYRAVKSAGKILEAVKVLPLSPVRKNELLAWITSGTKGSNGVKWIDYEIQAELVQAFENVWQESAEERGTQSCLRPEFLTELMVPFQDDYGQNPAAYYLVLATFFAHISSSYIFGEDTVSPFAIREFAMGLLNEVAKINPALISTDTLNDWKNRLMGALGAFTCSALISDDIRTFIQEEPVLNEVFDAVFPAKWR